MADAPDMNMAQSRLTGCFGKAEMEAAAHVMVKRAFVRGSWNVTFVEGDFDDRGYERAGLFMLWDYGWVARTNSDVFAPADAFVARVKEKWNRYPSRCEKVGCCA